MRVLSLLLLFFLLMPPSVLHAETERGELVIGLPGMPSHFNPAVLSGELTVSIGAQLFAGLTRLDHDGNAVPYLAQSWDVAPDGLSVLFHLRPGAVFHDGTPVTAADVAFSLLQCREYHPFRPMLTPVSAVETPDSLTVRVRLRHPYPTLPKVLTPALVPIMPRHVYGQGAPLPRHPANVAVVGSGPFRLESIEQGKAVRLVRHERFFLPGRPRLQRLTFRIFWDVLETVHAMQQGDVDIFSNFMTAYLRVLSPNVMYSWKRMTIHHLYGYNMLQYNLKKYPFSNPDVRKAFSLAFDRKKFSRICNDNVHPMHGPFPQAAPFSRYLDQPFDPVRANILLDEAGFLRRSDGTRFTVRLCYSPSWATWNPLNVEFIKFIQHEFSVLLGVVVQAQRIESFQQWQDIMSSGRFDIALDGLFFWQDPVIGFHRLYDSRNANRSLLWTNVSGYADPETDALLQQAMRSDDAARKDIYARIQERLVRDDPGLWIAEAELFLLLSPRVAHAESLVQGLLSPLDEVTCTERTETTERTDAHETP